MTDDSIAPLENKDQLISMVEAAEIYGFTAHYLRRLAKKGRLKAKKIDSFWVTTPAAVEGFIRDRQSSGFYRDDIHVDDVN